MVLVARENSVLSQIVEDEEGNPIFYKSRNGKYVAIKPDKIMLIMDAPGSDLPYTLYFWNTKDDVQGGRFITTKQVEELKANAKKPPEILSSREVHTIQ